MQCVLKALELKKYNKFGAFTVLQQYYYCLLAHLYRFVLLFASTKDTFYCLQTECSIFHRFYLASSENTFIFAFLTFNSTVFHRVVWIQQYLLQKFMIQSMCSEFSVNYALCLFECAYLKTPHRNKNKIQSSVFLWKSVDVDKMCPFNHFRKRGVKSVVL